MAILRKAGLKIKKGVEKVKEKRAVLKNSLKKATKKIIGKRKITAEEKVKPELKKEKKEIFGIQQVLVEKAKYYSPSGPSISRQMPRDLPYEYGIDRLVLQVRDSWWVFAYWEVTGYTWDRLKQELGDSSYNAKKILRVYDVNNIIFNGNNAHSFFDIELGFDSKNWYINIKSPGRAWCVDLGLVLPDGRFITILRSNTVHTPLDGPSNITDEEWMIPEEMFARLYGMGFGFGKSSPGKAWAESMKKALFSGVLASPGITSVSSPGKAQKQRKFWLVVDCELIVYGATEPDAKVTVQDKEIKLRPDGTFTLRFALPDGEQVIPVKAVSSDKIEERTITPIVSRQTKNSILVKESIV
ncbi:MAG: DUF4912 domain-containing protein [Candidatus Omnitrophota bacterium]